MKEREEMKPQQKNLMCVKYTTAQIIIPPCISKQYRFI